jgi:hypothetical protein
MQTELSDTKSNLSIQTLRARLARIQAQLQALGPMRPGSLSRQYNVCGQPGCRCKDLRKPRRHGPYYQLNYTYAGRKTTEFIRRQDVRAVRAQLANYRTFRRLVERWVGLAIRLAKIQTRGAA